MCPHRAECSSAHPHRLGFENSKYSCRDSAFPTDGRRKTKHVSDRRDVRTHASLTTRERDTPHLDDVPQASHGRNPSLGESLVRARLQAVAETHVAVDNRHVDMARGQLSSLFFHALLLPLDLLSLSLSFLILVVFVARAALAPSLPLLIVAPSHPRPPERAVLIPSPHRVSR